MLTDFKGISDNHGSEAVVIVGSGAVGLYLSVLLSRAGKTVILLESGHSELDGFDANAFESVGRKHDGIRISRSRTLGGTTNLWGGQLVEFSPTDFLARRWPNAEQWPIRYEELSRYYRPTYEALGLPTNLLDDDAVWQSVSHRKPDISNRVEVFLTRWMKIPNLAVLFKDEIQHSKNLVVACGCTATGFHFESDRIKAMDISDGKGNVATIKGKEFILAAGTFENARLMLFAATKQECPWKNNLHIGKRFQDHLGGRVAEVLPLKSGDFYRVFSTLVVRGNKFQPKVRWPDGLVRDEKKLSIQGMMSYEGSVTENLVFLKQFAKAAIFSRKIGSLREFAKNSFACSRYLLPLMWRYIVQNRILIPGSSRISLHVQSETIPLDESEISIVEGSRDRFGLPKLRLNWSVSGEEVHFIREFVKDVEIAFAANGLAELRIDKRLLENSPSFLDGLYDTGHQAGGCIMGHSVEDGVVDSNLRVFGVQNLSILGASVFRSCSNANTTFTAMTFATRLAHQLLAD